MEINELIEFLKEISPLVWATLIKQVYADASVKMIWFAVFIVITYSLAVQSKNENDDALSALSFLAGLVSLYFWISALQLFYNPEFYAIRFLLKSLGG